MRRSQEELKIHLCDNCSHSEGYPECPPDDAEFGTANGLDNVIKCSNYEGEEW